MVFGCQNQRQKINKPPVHRHRRLKQLYYTHYTISPSNLCFSLDPLHLTWNHMIAPRVWTTDSIVAATGNKTIVSESQKLLNTMDSKKKINVIYSQKDYNTLTSKISLIRWDSSLSNMEECSSKLQPA